MTRKCSLCKKELPLIAYHKNSNDELGIQRMCKDCRRVDNKERRRRKPRKNEKICEKCGKIKKKTEFYESRLTPDGLFGECKGCCKTRAPRSTNPKHYSEYFSTRRVL